MKKPIPKDEGVDASEQYLIDFLKEYDIKFENLIEDIHKLY